MCFGVDDDEHIIPEHVFVPAVAASNESQTLELKHQHPLVACLVHTDV